MTPYAGQQQQQKPTALVDSGSMENGPTANSEQDVVEPSFSDTSDFEDDIDDEELVGDILREKPDDSHYDSCCVIVDGIPVVGPERLEKLKNVLGKVFRRFNENCHISYPQEIEKEAAEGAAGEKTKGYCFVDYRKKSLAEEAAATLNGYKLDKEHTFCAYLFTDLEKFRKPLEKSWQPPKIRPYRDLGNLWQWLQNSQCQDQFALNCDRGSAKDFHSVVGIYWHRRNHEQPQLVDPEIAERDSWTESSVAWSPYGTFLTTFHSRGIALWAGEKFEQFSRFSHDRVSLIDFSPKESYLVTYGPPESRWNDKDCVRIWHVATGVMRRGFSPGMAALGRSQIDKWPFFQWSSDEMYFASLKQGPNGPLGISIYETETFSLVDKKSLLIENLKDFKWSPFGHYIAYCVEEEGESKPSVITVTNFAPQTQQNQQQQQQQQQQQKKRERSVRIFKMADATLYWQKSGDRLAVRNERYTKKKLEEADDGTSSVKYIGLTSNLEIFDLRVKDIPVESLQFDEANFVAFGWEPHGDKFCVLLGSLLKATPCIYRVRSGLGTKGVQLLSRVDTGMLTGLNTVLWAPNGGWLVVLSKTIVNKDGQSGGSVSGNILFVDPNALPEPAKLNAVEYPGMTDAQWDPTGRYLMAYTGVWGQRGQAIDNGFRIYSFQGKEQLRKSVDRLCQIIWRPRPTVKLSENKLKQVRRNLKTYSVMFDEDDKREKGKASEEVVAKRRELVAAYEQFRSAAKKLYAEENEEREKLRARDQYHGYEETDELEEETIEVPMSTEQTLVEKNTSDE